MRALCWTVRAAGSGGRWISFALPCPSAWLVSVVPGVALCSWAKGATAEALATIRAAAIGARKRKAIGRDSRWMIREGRWLSRGSGAWQGKAVLRRKKRLAAPREQAQRHG